jgi:hypothetical protein
VGDLTLAFESLELPADPGLSLLTYSAERGSVSRTSAGRNRSLGCHACEIVSGRGWVAVKSVRDPLRR